jgi:SAM-dependent methyltransferase
VICFYYTIGENYNRTHDQIQHVPFVPDPEEHAAMTPSERTAQSAVLPLSQRRVEDVPGHWLLARLGKRALRPGGTAMTSRLLRDASLSAADVVEFAPGLGRTATEILRTGPKSYLGIERDPEAARIVGELVVAHGECRNVDATATGLPDASADVVVGEAMLTMQTDRAKRAVTGEATRLLRPGGRYAIHEMALQPDDLDPAIATEACRGLAGSIKVNARLLTVAEWRALLEGSGLVVDVVRTAPMALLHLRRNVADEGVTGTLRIAGNVLRSRDVRRRVLDMWKTLHQYRHSIVAVSLIAHLPSNEATS